MSISNKYISISKRTLLIIPWLFVIPIYKDFTLTKGSIDNIIIMSFCVGNRNKTIYYLHV